MHVAVYRIPPRRLIVQVIDGDSAVRSFSEFAYQVADPGAGPRWVDRLICERGIVLRDVASACIAASAHALRVHTIAAIRVVRIVSGLLRIGGSREAAGAAVLRHPA